MKNSNTGIEEKLSKLSIYLVSVFLFIGLTFVPVFASAQQKNNQNIISNVDFSNITDTSADITWNTNQMSTGEVLYSRTRPVTLPAGSPTVSATTLAASQSVELSSLSPDTVYYFRIRATDQNGKVTRSGLFSFSTLTSQGTTTPPVATTTPPIISSVVINIGTTTAGITWNTDQPATSQVWFSTTTPIDTTSSTTPTVSDGSLLTNHNLSLSNLTASTTYFYIVKSVDNFGNMSTSSQSSFMTLSQ